MTINIQRYYRRSVSYLSDFLGKDIIEVFGHAKNYLAASLTGNALGFVALPIITRLLSPAEYGIVSIYLSVVSIFTVFLGLNMHAFLVRFYYEKSGNFQLALGTVLLFLLYFNLILFPFLFVFREYIAKFLEIQITVFLLAIGVSLLNVTQDLVLGYLRASKRSLQFSIISVAQQFGILFLSIILIIHIRNERYFGRIYGEFIVSTLFSIYFLYRLSSAAKFKWDTKLLKKSLLFSIPLIPHTMSNFVLSQFDRVILNQLQGPLYTGLYSFAYKVGSIMHIFIMGISKAWGPIFYEKMNDSDYAGINAVLKKSSNLLYFLAVGLILFAKELVILLSDKQYHDSLIIVPIIVIGYVFLYLYTTYGQYTMYEMRTALFSTNTIIAGTANIILNYAFIPRFGYMAAAVNTMISYFLLSVLHYSTARYIIKIKKMVPLRSMLPNIVFILIGACVFYLTEFYIQNYFISFFIRLLYISALAFILWGKRILGIVSRKTDK